MKRLTYKFSDIRWDMDFSNEKFMFSGFDPRVFNMFAAAYNERANVVNSFRLHQYIPAGFRNPAIPMNVAKRDGYYYHDVLREVEDGSYCYDPVVYASTTLERDVTNQVGGLKFNTNEYNYKTRAFDLPHQHPYNTWWHLIRKIKFLMQYYVKNRIAPNEKIHPGDFEKLPTITNWLATTKPRFNFQKVYSTSLNFRFMYDNRAFNPNDPNYVEWSPDPEQVRPYGPSLQFGGRLFRRRYLRTIVRLDDKGKKGQRARLIRGDTSTLLPNPTYDPNLPESNTNPKLLRQGDPAYNHIAANYNKLYVYDDQYIKPDGNLGQWVLNTDLKIFDPDIIEAHGWPQIGDYFGYWVLEDLRKVLNYMDWTIGSASTVPFIDYVSNSQSFQPPFRTIDEPGAQIFENVYPVKTGDTRIYVNTKVTKVVTSQQFAWPEVGDYIVGTFVPNKIKAVDKQAAYFDLERPVGDDFGTAITINPTDFYFFVTFKEPRLKWSYTYQNFELDQLPPTTFQRNSADRLLNRWMGPTGRPLFDYQEGVILGQGLAFWLGPTPSGVWGPIPEPAFSMTIGAEIIGTKLTGNINIRFYESHGKAKYHLFGLGKVFGVFDTQAPLDADLSPLYSNLIPRWSIQYFGSLTPGGVKSGKQLLIDANLAAADFYSANNDPNGSKVYRAQAKFYESLYPEEDFKYQEVNFSSPSFVDDPNTLRTESAFDYHFLMVAEHDFDYAEGKSTPAPAISKELEIANRE